jgi:hypothetical protein
MNISPGVRKSLVDMFPYPARQPRPRDFQIEMVVSM